MGRSDTRIHLRFAIDDGAITGVSPADAKVAFTLWVKEIVAHLQLNASVDACFLRSPKALGRAIERKEGDIFLLNVHNYLRLRSRFDLDPLTTVKSTKDVGRVNVFLAPRSLDWPKGKGPDDALRKRLRSGKLLIHRGGKGDTPLLWLRRFYRRGGLPSPRKAFRRIGYPMKPSRAVLPVFFGQALACVVARTDYATICELNPQVGKQLQVIAASPVVESVICMRRKLVEELAARVDDSFVRKGHPDAYVAWKRGGLRALLLHLLVTSHDYPAGRQLNLLFRVERNIPYREEHVRTAIDLQKTR